MNASPPARLASAFTLLEVMIAVALFFMVAFSVLALVSQNLRGARLLQTSHISAGMIASQLMSSNKLDEGTASGTFEDIFPGLYPGFTWVRDIYLVSSNGLFQADIVVLNGAREESAMSILLFKPNSAIGGSTGSRLGSRSR